MDAYQAAREALSEFRQQDDYLLAHGASLMSDDSHEILHTDTLRRAVAAATAQQADEIERLRDALARILTEVRDELPGDEPPTGIQTLAHTVAVIATTALAPNKS